MKLEGEPISLTAPDIASARPVRSLGYSSRLSYKQRALSVVFAALALPGIAGMAPRTVFGQTGPDQKDEQMIGPNQFTNPVVAGVVSEAEADTPAEDSTGLDDSPVDPDTILAAMDVEPITTPELTVVPTTELTVSPTSELTLSVESQQFELKMNVDPEVPATDVQYARDGVNSSRAYMLRHFGLNLDGTLVVNLRDDTTIPHQSFRLIKIGVRHNEWVRSKPIGKRNTAAHETGHQLSQILTNNLESGKWGDWFLQEGTAQYIADKGLTEAGYYPNDQKEACDVLLIIRNPVHAPLRQMDSSNPRIPVWSVASLAIQYMVEQFGDQSLADYWRLVRANGPENAFKMATGGISLDQFANQFDQKRRTLTFPGEKYRYWVGQDPCVGL